MKLFTTVLIILIIIGLGLACSGCTVNIENLTQNKTLQAGKEPLNVPEYPNATRTSYSNVRFVGQVITYQTNDTPKQVLEFYTSQMQERGYNISRNVTSASETGGLIIFAKGQDTVWVTVGQNNGLTSIALRTSFQA
ncbi:MAG: hypothetical protein ABR979_06590 [Halobacteriota archaeon]|jgi:hypothetical protein